MFTKDDEGLLRQQRELARSRTDSELIEILRKVSGPIISKLTERGYRIDVVKLSLIASDTNEPLTRQRITITPPKDAS